MSSDPHHDTGVNAQLRLGALVGVLGVVYGDIGTSPLYALQTCLAYFTGKGLSSLDILGLLSLIAWALIITVTLKYVTFVMRADNHGEGGILALMALAQRVAKSDRTRTFLGLVGITGAGLFFGDGMITPAISVLSAVSGLQVVWPTLIQRPGRRDFAGRHRRAVPVAKVRHRQHGAGLRTCHGRLVHRHRPAWPCPGRAAPLHLQGAARRPMASSSCCTINSLPSSRSARSCWRLPAPKRCMRTWAISAASPSGSPGPILSCPACC